MKVVVETNDEEGLEALMAQTITVWCGVYIYTGKLVGINGFCIKLEDPKVVYETGDFKVKDWKDAQPMTSKHWYVTLQSIESFGIMK